MEIIGMRYQIASMALECTYQIPLNRALTGSNCFGRSCMISHKESSYTFHTSQVKLLQGDQSGGEPGLG